MSLWKKSNEKLLIAYILRLNRKTDCLRCLHHKLYNAGLEERIDAYKKNQVSIGFNDQCKSLTVIRAEHPEYENLNAQSEQVTLKRLDRAFQNFFRRVKAGKEKPGFTRFEALKDLKGGAIKIMVMGGNLHQVKIVLMARYVYLVLVICKFVVVHAFVIRNKPIADLQQMLASGQEKAMGKGTRLSKIGRLRA